MNQQEKAIELAHIRLKAQDRSEDGKITKKALKQFYKEDKALKAYFSTPDLMALAEYYFDTLDYDRDDVIQMQEILIRDTAFKSVHHRLIVQDKKGDGKVTMQELKLLYQADKGLQHLFSPTDLLGMAEYFFQKLDQDNVGFIRLRELV